MALKEPTSMDQCLYFTNRTLAEGGRAKAWVYKVECSECEKGVMQKPRNPKTGRPKTRSSKYICDECGHEESKKSVEDRAKLEMKYTCPHCGKKGEGSTDYKRRTYYGVKAFVVRCEHCDDKVAITKRMKRPKKKKKKKK